MQTTLEGIRVVEQGTFITGPCAGMMLADLGADVVKIEGPEGDPYRSYQEGKYSPHFQAYNRNKRSLVLDMKSADDGALFARLIKGADVYRPRLAQAYILRTSDDRLVAIHLSSLEKFWTGLVAALEAPELATDPRFNPRLRRIDNYELLKQDLTARFAQHPLAHWIHRLQAEDVPHACVNRLDEVLKDPQVEHLGIVVPTLEPHGATAAVRPAWQFDNRRANSVYAAPVLNQHGESIRAALLHQDWPVRSVV
jgi:crotonobetainyl-CoA:carnitine CoA-transferase CaiB-like acyl-CoA transferase